MSPRGVSVVIPHYEKQRAFRSTWRKLGPQIKPRDEVIIIDDNSPSGPPELEEENVKIIELEPLEKHIYRLNTLRNTGVKKASNDTVIILDPDCIPNRYFIQNAKQVFNQGVLFGGFIDYIDYNRKITKRDPRANLARTSRWVDQKTRGCAYIWGGCMMFSKKRTKKIGWFDVAYDGEWGAEDHDFASRCYHSGMRLRHERGLRVFHQKHKGGGHPSARNRVLWKKRMQSYKEQLSEVTDYKPETVVFVVIEDYSDGLDSRMTRFFRLNLPVKVCLINNSKNPVPRGQTVLNRWTPRWAVDYTESNKTKEEHIKHYKTMGYKYFIHEENCHE